MNTSQLKKIGVLFLGISVIVISCKEESKPDTSQTTEKAQKPNIVLIMSDDQGWGDLSMNGRYKKKGFSLLLSINCIP